MRVLLAISLIAFTQAAKRAINLPCNKELDGLLAMDPEGNPSAFLSCQGVGVGNIGFWERKVCPDNMIFDFINQQCKSSVVRKQHRKQQTGLNIAILNNSCAKGETCIGGTVCDLDTLRCLCPYGTIPQLDTLSCIKSENLFNPERFQFSFENNNQGSGNFHPNMNQQTISNNNNNGGFVPNPNFNKFPSTNNQFVGNSNNNNNNNNFNNNFGNNQWPAPPSPSASSFNSFGGSGDMQPNPNQKFVFGNFMASSTVAPTTKKIPLLAEPGKSCRSNEICIGGSICTLPIGLCLCPGDLEAREGECVLPPTSSITIQKVGIGAICNDLAECDNGSSCQMGRCACVAPLIQFEGKCVLRQERKEVGPGELCDNGEICIKGSVCDNIIPVCVCPPETDLSNGECIHVQKGNVQTAPPTYQYTPPPTLSPQTTNYIPPTTPQPTYIPIQPQQLVTFTQAPTSKPNHMKIALGGSKQAGVGVRCSLNTDCMIGAYCNGNTNPPSCQCLSTHVNVEGRCEKVIYPGQVGCRSDMQCSAAYAGTTCVDRLCKCPEGTKTVDQTCIPGPKLSSSLSECHPTCQPPLICSNKHCVCPSNTNCLPDIVQPGTFELNSSGKVDNIIITNSIRRLRRQTSNLVCWPGSSTCSDGHGVCISNKCHCINGLVPRDGYCRPVLLPLNSSCELENLSAVCEDGTICMEGFCKCLSPGGCESSHASCESHIQCPQTFLCIGGICKCDDGMTVQNGQCHPSEDVIISYKNINNPCNSTVDRCSGGSICHDNLCQCMDNSVEKMGRCQQLPGGRCSDGQTCINGSICEFGRCQCEPGRVTSTRTPNFCTVAAVEAGKSCQLGEKCLHGSVCRFGICMCLAKRISINGRCVRRDSAPVKMKKTTISTTSGLTSTTTVLQTIPTTTSTTTTTTTTATTSEAQSTLPLITPGSLKGPGELCTLFDMCSGGSLCREGMCVCQEHDIIIGHECVKSQEQAIQVTSQIEVSAPGQSCNVKTKCTGGSICIEKVCRCETGFLNSQGVCQTPSLSPSSTTKTPTTTSTSMKMVIPPQTTGQKAKKSSSTTEELLPAMECILTAQCPFRTECIQGLCRCRHGETIVDGTCRQAIHQVRPGATCNPQKGYDCVGESFCVYGVCTCLHHMQIVAEHCVPDSQLQHVGPGRRCEAGLKCSGGSRCIEGICRCDSDEVPDVNDKCVKKKSVYPILKATTPSTTFATLPPTITTTTTAPTTTTTVVPTLGETCVDFCAVGVCQYGICVDSMAELERRELQLKQNPSKSSIADVATNEKRLIDEIELNGLQCSKDADCPLSAYCLQNTCFCKSGYRSTAGYCEKIVSLGSPCISTNQCPIHAICLQGTCRCAASLRDGKACRPPRLGRPGDACSEQVICSYNSYCGLMSGVCECPSGMATYQAECRQTAEATGKACVTSRNCHRFSYCDNGYCLCKSGFELVNNFCMPPAQRLTINQIEELMQGHVENERNDGPQAPMQERIRTETYLNSAGMMNKLVHNQQMETNSIQNSNFPPTSAQQPQTIIQTNTVPPMNFKQHTFTFVNPSVFYPTSTPRVIMETTAINQFGFNPRSFGSFPILSGTSILSGDIGLKSSSSSKSGSLIFNSLSPKNMIAKMRFAMPGEYCGDKATCLGNSFCTDDFCRCPENCSAQNGLCAFKPQSFGRPLQDSAGSSQKNTIDDDDDFLSSEERQFSQPLENCQNFEFCVGGSECLQLAAGLGLLCQCPLGTIYLQDECIETPRNLELIGIEETCSNEQLCLGGASCVSGKCICNGGRRNVLGICVHTAHPGDDCSRGQLCVDGSLCAGPRRTCICPPGKRSLLGRCVEPEIDSDDDVPMSDDIEEAVSSLQSERLTSAYPGENCETLGTICMDNSRCTAQHICECQPRFFNVDGRCVPVDMVRRPTEACTPTTICVTGSRCVDNLCRCADGLMAADDRCVPVSNDIRRHEANSPIATGGTATSTCTSDSDCPMHFRCHDKLCVCHGTTSECLSIMLLSVDAQCSGDQNCPINSKCNEGICICDDGYRMEADRCVYRSQFSTSSHHLDVSPSLLQKLPMFAHEQPPPQSNNRLSGIPTATTVTPDIPTIQQIINPPGGIDGLTLKRIPSISAPTDPAVATRILSSFLNALSKASDVVRLDSFLTTTSLPIQNDSSADKRLAQTTAFSVPGQPCSLPFLICSNNAICFNDFCICSYEHVVINDTCVPRDGHIPLGHVCSETQRCSPGLTCLNDKCSCYEDDVSCQPNEPVTSPPGGSCTDARECTGGSVCREGWCICPDPSMIVQKGICIQSGIRPTLPPKTVQTYTTAPPPTTRPTVPPTVATYRPTQNVNTFNALPSPTTQGRKVVPGSQCGPLDTCVGGSMCLDAMCVCPAGSEAKSTGRCEAITTTTQTSTQPTTRATWKTSTRRPVDFIELPTHAPFVVDYNSNQRNINHNKLPTPEYTSLSSGYNGHNVEQTYTRPSVASASASKTTTATVGDHSECEALGLFCRGNTICINKSCQCPEGHILHNDGCVPPSEAGKRKVRGKARHQAATNANIAYSAPGEYCGDGHVCSGGSSCGEDKTCACPTEKPMIKYGECHAVQPKRQGVAGESCDENTECINGSNCHSGQCRCAPQFVALSGFCVNMPMSTTPQMKTFAKPLENCENGEICEGGSNCDYDTGICLCPAGQVAFGPECRVPPTAASNIPSNVAMNPATTDCENDDNCGDGKLCVAGRCRCKPGTVDNAGICELLEEIEIGDRPIPISYARHRVLTEKQKNSSSRETIQSSPSATESTASNRDTSEETTEVKDTVVETTVATTTTTTTDPPSATAPSINRAPSRAETQKPRIVGPPIRRPKPKSKGSSGSGNGGSPASYKTGGSGNGNCPPGNEATRDSSGKLILCNGLEPNCPPRSYCYITSGGFATEEYNCCKSW